MDRNLRDDGVACVFVPQEGVEVRVARIFNTFGSRMHMNDGRVVSNFILQALQGEPLTVRPSPYPHTVEVLITPQNNTFLNCSCIELSFLLQHIV